MEQIGEKIPKYLLGRATSRINQDNQDQSRTKSIPGVTMKQFMGWVGSEYAFSNSKEDGYKKFRRTQAGRERSQGLELWQKCRKFFASELTENDMADFCAMFQDNFRRGHRCGAEVAVDELLSGWESEIYREYLTEMDRKPHSPGLCYYLAVERVLYGNHYVRYCFDLEPSILNPKLTATQACIRLVERFPLVNPGLRPIMYCDAAFCNKDLLETLQVQRQPFVIAGAGQRLPLVTALAGSHLPIDSHLLLEDHEGLLYSYTLMTKEEMSEKSIARLTPKVAVTNAFYTSNRESCRCVPLATLTAANELDAVSNDTLHIICEKLGLQEGEHHVGPGLLPYL